MKVLQYAGWLTLFLVIVFLLTGTAEAAGPTYVFGEVSGHWTVENSPYILTSDVTVKHGKELIIEAGVVVKARYVDVAKPHTRRAVIRVCGRLTVAGSRAAPVIFTGYDEGVYGSWGGIWVDGLSGGTANIEWAEIKYAERGLYVTGATASVTSCTFSNNFYAMYITGGSQLDLQKTIAVSNEYGLYSSASQAQVGYNLFASNVWGVYSYGQSKVVLEHNDIKNNTFGYTCDGASADEISYNDFSIRSHNDYALYIRDGSPTLLTNNNFLFDETLFLDPGTVFWYCWNDSQEDIIAGGNYWGTTREAIIDEYIYDQNDEAGRGMVRYEPLAGEPVANTIDDIRAPIVSITSALPFSPNGDGLNDTSVISYSLSEDALQVSFQVLDINGLMGEIGAVLFQQTIETGEQIRDGAHEITWDGISGSGATLCDGQYLVRMQATDRENPKLVSEYGERYLEVDTQPPALTVGQPADETVVHTHLIEVSGQVDDRDPNPKVRSRGVQARLDQGDFFATVELEPGINQVTVVAQDWAGNETTVDRLVRFEPVITVEVSSPTNESSQVVTGQVYSDQGAQIEVRVEAETGPATYYQAIYSGGQGEWSSPPLPLELGANRITATLLGSNGEVIGQNGAEIVYDPCVNQELSFQFPPGLQMIGLPMVPNNGDHGMALGKSDIAIARWQQSDQGYVYYPDSRLEAFAPGRGYWLQVEESLSGTMIGTIADPTASYRIPLQKGWNQIANPFSSARNFQSEVQVAVDGRVVDMDTAFAQGFLTRGLWGYDGGYALTDTLQPWKGYWLRANRDLELVVAPPATTKGTSSERTREAEEAGSYKPNILSKTGQDGWSMRLILEGNQARDGDNWIGQVDGAAEGYDHTCDLLEPPEGPDGLQLAILGRSDSRPVKLAADYRASGSGKQRWTLVIKPGKGQPVNLRWQATEIPVGKRIYLVDESTGRRFPMGPSGEYELEGVGSRQISIVARSESSPQVISDVWLYPNPVRHNGELTVRFTLAAVGEVEMLVYDVVGNYVFSQRLFGFAGENEIQWNLHSASGNRVAGGLYYLVLRIPGREDETQVARRVGVIH